MRRGCHVGQILDDFREGAEGMIEFFVLQILQVEAYQGRAVQERSVDFAHICGGSREGDAN